jgi:hypothetical protein
VVAAYAVSFVPGIGDWSTSVAASVQQPARTAAFVLGGRVPAARPAPGPYGPGAGGWAVGAAAAAGAVLLAAVSLWWQRAGALLGRTGAALGRALLRPVDALKAVHDGALGDYGLWFMAGLAVAGAGWGLALR